MCVFYLLSHIITIPPSLLTRFNTPLCSFHKKNHYHLYFRFFRSPASCDNRVQDNGEVDVDCGNPDQTGCRQCGYNKKCVFNTDCLSYECSPYKLCEAYISAATLNTDSRASAVVAVTLAAFASALLVFMA